MASAFLRTTLCSLASRRLLRTPLSRPAAAQPLQRQVRFNAALSSALEKELQEAKDLPKPAPASPPGFTLTDREGYNLILLKGTFGTDLVTVQFSIPQRLEFDIPVKDLKLPFVVLIKKPQRGLIEVSCETCDQGYEVTKVAFFDEKDKKMAEEETAEADYQRDLRYSGPHLDDLEEAIQTGLADFLQEKGITDELARYIQVYIKETKEPKEYARWVSGLLKFVKG